MKEDILQENSRHIVRFSLITQTRTKEFSVPPGRNKNKNTKISVHADETGLWITYDNKDGKMVATKLSESSLTPKVILTIRSLLQYSGNVALGV